MRYDLFSIRPDAALDMQLSESNKYLPSHSYTIDNIVDLGAAANPNTSARLNGSGVQTVGSQVITFNRMNPKNTFGKFGAAVKRPVVQVHARDGQVGGAMTLTALAEAINRTLGVALACSGTYADLDGTTTVTMPTAGGYVDVDLVLNKANSLRFRPSATDKMPLRLVAAGRRWPATINSDDVRPTVENKIDDTDRRLIAHIPFGADLTAAWGGEFVNLDFTSTGAYATAGDVRQTASLTRLAATEYTVTDEYLLMPLYKNWTDLVSGAAGTITAGTAVSTWASAGARDDVAMVPHPTSGVLATVPNNGNVRALFGGKKDFCIEMEVKLPSAPGTGYQMLFGTYGTGGTWTVNDAIGIFVHGDIKRLFLSARVGTGGSSLIYMDGICDDKWHTVTFTRIGSRWIGMVDGKIVSDVTSDITVNTPTSTLTIGQSPAKTVIYKGQMRNLRVWNFAKFAAEYQPLKYYDAAIAKQNIVSMVGKEYSSVNWVGLHDIVPTVSEPTGTSVKWAVSIDGVLYRYVTGQGLSPIADDAVAALGMTTTELRTLFGSLSSNPFGAKFALVAALVTTNGNLTPTITSVAVYPVAKFSALAGVVVSAPAANQPLAGLRGGIGTKFNGNGINIGVHGASVSKAKLGNIFGGYNDWTVEFDIARITLGLRQTIIWQRASSASTVMSLYIGFQTDDKIEFGYYPDAGTSWVGAKTSIGITDTLPHHIEINRSGGVMRCFIDGKLAGSFAATANNCSVPTSAYYIGRQATSETSWQGALYAYLRDFMIYNYAKHTADYAVEPITIPTDGIVLNDTSLVSGGNRTVCAAQLFNVDFGPALYGVGQSTIASEAVDGKLSGSVITAINDKLAAINIPVQLPSTVALVGMTISDMFNHAPVAASGHNPRMSRVVVISTVGMIHDDTIEVGATLALHIA